MKKFYINEKIISIGDRYKIFNEDGSIAYEIKERLFAVGKQFALYSSSGTKLAHIKKKLFRLLPRYNIYIDNKHIATIKKRFTFFVKKYDILSPQGNYLLNGDILAWNFNISKDGNVFCSVSKNFNLFVDKYEVLVADGFDEILSLCLVIVLDSVHHDNKRRRR